MRLAALLLLLSASPAFAARIVINLESEREMERVLDDVRAGLVSVEAAATDYGVVIDAHTLSIDVVATNALRAKARGPQSQATTAYTAT